MRATLQSRICIINNTILLNMMQTLGQKFRHSLKQDMNQNTSNFTGNISLRVISCASYTVHAGGRQRAVPLADVTYILLKYSKKYITYFHNIIFPDQRFLWLSQGCYVMMNGKRSRLCDCLVNQIFSHSQPLLSCGPCYKSFKASDLCLKKNESKIKCHHLFYH